MNAPLPTRIQAGLNLVIETQPGRWRLMQTTPASPDAITLDAIFPLETMLFEAQRGEPLRYSQSFAAQRRLPLDELLTENVQRIVVGWSDTDGAWHLGLMFEADLAERRGSRWCQLATWEDRNADARREDAKAAGQAMATVIDRPFALVPPKQAPSVIVPQPSPYTENRTTSPVVPVQPSYEAPPIYMPERAAPSALYSTPTVPTPIVPPVRDAGGYAAVGTATAGYPAAPYAPVYPSAPGYAVYTPPAVPPPLPLALEGWTLRPGVPGTLELALSGSWARGKFLRAIWYGVLSVAFLLLSVASIAISPPPTEFLWVSSVLAQIDTPPPPLPGIAGIAVPQPEFLPYLGLICAVVLIIAALTSLIRILVKVNRIEIRPDGVVGLHGRTRKWAYAAEALSSVYVSEIFGKANRNKRVRTVQYGEINLYHRDASFQRLATFNNLDEKLTLPDNIDLDSVNVDSVGVLTAANAFSRAEGAAVHIAAILRLPAYHDIRVGSSRRRDSVL